MAVQLEEDDFKTHTDWALWRRIVPLALRYKRQLYPLAFVAVLVALVDALFAQVTRWVIDAVQIHGRAADLQPYIWAYMGLTVALGFFVWAFIVLAGKIATHMSHDIRRDLFAKLQQLSFSYFDRRPVGWLMSRMTTDCSRLAEFIAWGALDAFWAIALMLAVAAIMLVMNVKLALVVLAVTPLLLGTMYIFKRVMLYTSRAIRKLNSKITASYNEGIMGARTSKTLVREDQNAEEFGALADEMYAASIRNALQGALFLPTVVTLASIGTGLALWYGGVHTIAGDISLGTLVAFMSYAGFFFNPTHQLAIVLTNSQRAQASAERILELLHTEPEIADGPDVWAALEKNSGQCEQGLAPDGFPAQIETVEFRNVTFAYKDGPVVLRDFNLKVRAGQTVALVGPTGGGKSTIVSLLCRFYEPVSGEILINGVDYRKRSLHWLQSNFGIVLQTPHLFSGTVKENIRYGRLDATDAEVAAAAARVNAHDFISALENGYDTPVGEGGNRLSTGQKQLVSFARAVLANPQLFVMDEATSAVDTQTEKLIQKGLEVVLQGRISFVIAHRLSTIRNANIILVVENGAITEHGSHHELILQRGNYYELYTNQFVHEKEEEVLTGK